MGPREWPRWFGGTQSFLYMKQQQSSSEWKRCRGFALQLSYIFSHPNMAKHPPGIFVRKLLVLFQTVLASLQGPRAPCEKLRNTNNSHSICGRCSRSKQGCALKLHDRSNNNTEISRKPPNRLANHKTELILSEPLGPRPELNQGAIL